MKGLSSNLSKMWVKITHRICYRSLPFPPINPIIQSRKSHRNGIPAERQRRKVTGLSAGPKAGWRMIAGLPKLFYLNHLLRQSNPKAFYSFSPARR